MNAVGTIHRMNAGRRVAPKRKPRRFIADYPIEVHRQVGEGDITSSTGFEIMGSDRAHKRWRGGKTNADPIDLMDESDIEFITGIRLVESIPGLPFGDALGNVVGGNPERNTATRELVGPAKQGWYVFDKTEGRRYRIDTVDRMPDGRALFKTQRVTT